MKRTFGCLAFVILFIAIGAYAGMQFVGIRQSGVLNRWKGASLPEGLEAAYFLPAIGGKAYVKTPEGRIFLQDLSQYKDLSWIEVGTTQSQEEEFHPGDCQVVPLEVEIRGGKKPPRNSVEKLECWYGVHADYNIDFVFVILENGDIRRWERHEPGIASIGYLFFYPILGGMIGVFLGLLVYWLITWIRDRGKPKEPIEEIERVSLID
jgi:hypothetical protein